MWLSTPSTPPPLPQRPAAPRSTLSCHRPTTTSSVLAKLTPTSPPPLLPPPTPLLPPLPPLTPQPPPLAQHWPCPSPTKPLCAPPRSTPRATHSVVTTRTLLPLCAANAATNGIDPTAVLHNNQHNHSNHHNQECTSSGDVDRGFVSQRECSPSSSSWTCALATRRTLPRTHASLSTSATLPFARTFAVWIRKKISDRWMDRCVVVLWCCSVVILLLNDPLQPLISAGCLAVPVLNSLTLLVV